MVAELSSIGKVRGLDSTSTPLGVFAVLAFDHRQSFVKMLRPGGGGEAAYAEVVAAKSSVVRILAPHASAVLLDPVYSAAQAIAGGALPGQTGLMVAVEETGYTGSTIARRSSLLPGWNVEKIKRMGAQAVKLLIYYHPQAGEIAAQQERFAAEVAQACRRADIAFFLEVVSYSLDEQAPRDSAAYARQLPQVVAESARRLGGLGADVLKLEFPVNARHDPDEAHWSQACEAVSAASPIPWAVLSGGVEFPVFARQVEVACRAGASGFIGGRAVWQEGISLAEEPRQTWLREVAARRLDELTEIADRFGRSWRYFYPGLERAAAEDWYLEYGDQE